jgi:hypothetical protein
MNISQNDVFSINNFKLPIDEIGDIPNQYTDFTLNDYKIKMNFKSEAKSFDGQAGFLIYYESK